MFIKYSTIAKTMTPEEQISSIKKRLDFQIYTNDNLLANLKEQGKYIDKLNQEISDYREALEQINDYSLDPLMVRDIFNDVWGKYSTNRL